MPETASMRGVESLAVNIESSEQASRVADQFALILAAHKREGWNDGSAANDTHGQTRSTRKSAPDPQRAVVDLLNEAQEFLAYSRPFYADAGVWAWAASLLEAIAVTLQPAASPERNRVARAMRSATNTLRGIAGLPTFPASGGWYSEAAISLRDQLSTFMQRCRRNEMLDNREIIPAAADWLLAASAQVKTFRVLMRVESDERATWVVAIRRKLDPTKKTDTRTSPKVAAAILRAVLRVQGWTGAEIGAAFGKERQSVKRARDSSPAPTELHAGRT